MLRFLRSGSRHTKMIWWIITIATAGSFALMFNAFGTGFDSRNTARRGAVGVVNGREISNAEYQSALADQSDNYRRQYGANPSDRDLRMVELQAWRGLIAQHLVGKIAAQEGITAHDDEVKWSLKTSPPSVVTSNPALQTNGKFDPEKFQAAIKNPNVNWGEVEELVRETLPTRQLEQRMLSSIKLSQPELRDEWRYRYDRVSATLVQIPPAGDPGVPPPTAADLERAYEQNKGRFVSGLRVQLEVVVQPRKYSDDDLRTARQQAQSIVERARKGEDFAQLAKDYSEGPAADKGGVIDRVVQAGEFGVMGQHMETLQPGQITDAFQDNGRFLIFKLLSRVPAAGSTPGGMKVAQIVIKAHPSETVIADQVTKLGKLRERALRIGLGKAAAEQGLGTAKTRFFDMTNPPEELYTTPEVSDWAMREKVGKVSPVFEGIDEFVIAEVAARHEAGPASRDELADPLRQLAETDLRVDRAKPRADSLAALLAQGRTLEQAAQAMGIKPTPSTTMTRSAPIPTLMMAPDVLGMLFAAPTGRVVGPLRSYAGWTFARVDQRAPADSASFEQNKGQISSEILTRRQQSFFNSMVNDLLSKAKVDDLRHETVR